MRVMTIPATAAIVRPNGSAALFQVSAWYVMASSRWFDGTGQRGVRPPTGAAPKPTYFSERQKDGSAPLISKTNVSNLTHQ
jgi:hypothetical protein